MAYLVLACEALRPEIEYVIEEAQSIPEIIYMEQELHNIPDKMRAVLQEKISGLEKERQDIDEIVMGFGLCGRGTAGVKTDRVTLVYPRVHDCVPLYFGLPQKETSKFQEGKLCLAAGALKYGKIAQHLTENRYKVYAEKFGEKRAKKMIQAENSVFSNYKSLCHIKWPGMDESLETLAKRLAQEIELPYEECEGKSIFIRELLDGGKNTMNFIRLEPGKTLDMNTAGDIIAI